jgi:DNA-directed RNA polymerase subunit alpha
MGTTVGNSLRRVLLSSLHGTAITSIKIDGVEHEFSTIPNVVEDTLDIICNLKGVVFKTDEEEFKNLKIRYNGKGIVRASDIQHDSTVEIINPEHTIAEVADGGTLNIDINVKRSVGYSTAEANKEDDQDINTINIDAAFSPIVRVNHVVDNIRVGKELDHDSLTLDIYTNGSIKPDEAVKEAATILVQQLGLFGAMNQKPIAEPQPQEVESQSSSNSAALNLSIDDLELSARSSNCLKRAGIETVGQLVEKGLSELIQIKNFGKKSADEINDKLKQYSLCLKDSDAETEEEEEV